MKTALTIAGTDPSGGAGIQADIKTMTANGVYAMSAVTALVAQNTTGVKSIMEVTPEFLAEQLDCVFTDIMPDAVKTGMVSSVPLIQVIARKLKEYRVEKLVVDPVMVATSGDRLISEEAVDALKAELLPLATVLTPNIPEWFYGRRIDNPNTHGTGCTLSSAIASNLAKGYDLDTSVERAKTYLSGALASMLDLGQGKGPLDHLFNLEGEFVK